MMNQIKELNNNNCKRFIIEVNLILLDSQKRYTISLFIYTTISVLELKRFISKDFEFSIQSMILFYPPKGIIDNAYKFLFEPNKIITIDLIIDRKKNQINKLNKEIALKNINYDNLPKNISNCDKFLLNNKNNKNNLINNYIKPYNDINNTVLLNPYNNLLNNPFNDNKQCQLPEKTNYFNNQINNNICKSIIKDNKTENLNNIYKIDNNNLNQIKNNKCNFILTKIDNKQKIANDNLLGKKRSFPATFKTTILNKENEITKQKNMIKPQNNSNIKIVNFSVNKNVKI
jgi:hypothetical protein